MNSLCEDIKNDMSYLIVGHGTTLYHKNFKVPVGVRIVFLADPGQDMPIRGHLDEKFKNLIKSKVLLTQFVQGTLRDEPNYLSSGYTIRKHTYMPGSMCPELYLEFYDHDPQFDRYFGVWKLPKKVRTLYGDKGLLSQLVERGTYFVSACRGGKPSHINTTALYKSAVQLSNKIMNPVNFKKKYGNSKSLYLKSVRHYASKYRNKIISPNNPNVRTLVHSENQMFRMRNLKRPSANYTSPAPRTIVHRKLVFAKRPGH